MKNFFRRDTCRLCKSQNLEPVLHMTSTPIGDDFIPPERLDEVEELYPLEVDFCRDCGLLQLVNVINPEITHRDYLYETSTSPGLKAHFQDYVDEVIREINPPAGSLVVDIGSSDGTILHFFKRHEMRVLGIEPAQNIAQKARESGIETVAEFFTTGLAQKIKKTHGTAAIITANNVFANVDELDDFISGVKDLLSPDGVFIFETGYMVDLVNNTVADNINHDHLCYLSLKPLVSFFDHNGMEMIDVERIATKGGSIRCFVQLKGGSRPILRSVAELMSLEKEMGFESMIPFQLFVERLEGVKKQLRKTLFDLKEQGKSIAVFGAAIGVTTLLYYFDLKDVVSYLVDDDPGKWGFYSAGLHFPILPSKVLYERKPDYVVILAWRYAGPILKKHQAYLDQGGSFIKILPAVELVSSKSECQLNTR